MQQFTHWLALGQAVLDGLPEWDDRRARLARCRQSSRCGAAICPVCSFSRAARRRDDLLGVASPIDQKRLRLLSFRAGDVPLSDLRHCSRELMRAARTTISKLRIPGAAIHLESPVSEMDSELWHPHVHMLTHVPIGGRNFVRPGDWAAEFYEQLPNTWHPAANHAHVSGVIESIEAASAYCTKSAFHMADIGAVPGIVASINTLAGLPQYITSGSLRA